MGGTNRWTRAKIELVNYILRGLAIPSGTHEIEFRFEPKVIEQGSAIQIGAIVLLLFLLVLSIKETVFSKKQQS